MSYVPPQPPAGAENYNVGSVLILQYPNQQIISRQDQYRLHTGDAYDINTNSAYYIEESTNSLSPWYQFADYLPIVTASNNLTANDVTTVSDFASSDIPTFWCVEDAPTGYFSGFDSHSIYKYIGGISSPTPTNPPTVGDWLKVTSLSDIGPGAWFNTVGNYSTYITQMLFWNGTQLITGSNIPVSASIPGSSGFLQLSGSYGTGPYAGLFGGGISLMCVATSSTDPAGATWLITDAAPSKTYLR